MTSRTATMLTPSSGQGGQSPAWLQTKAEAAALALGIDAIDTRSEATVQVATLQAADENDNIPDQNLIGENLEFGTSGDGYRVRDNSARIRGLNTQVGNQ